MNVFSRENVVIGAFVVLALVGFYAVLESTGNETIAIATALLLGVIVPTIIVDHVS